MVMSTAISSAVYAHCGMCAVGEDHDSGMIHATDHAEGVWSGEGGEMTDITGEIMTESEEKSTDMTEEGQGY